MKKYIEQWERVQRWYRVFEDITFGRRHDLTTEHYLDMVLAFFINCYQLKDWIKNDDECNVEAKIVEDFVELHQELKLCRKISNGAKHLYFRGEDRGGEPAFHKKDIDLQICETVVKITIRFFVMDQSKEHDAFQVATDSMILWENFLQQKELLI